MTRSPRRAVAADRENLARMPGLGSWRPTDVERLERQRLDDGEVASLRSPENGRQRNCAFWLVGFECRDPYQVSAAGTATPAS